MVASMAAARHTWLHVVMHLTASLSFYTGPVLEWTARDVASWIDGLGLGEYSDAFRREEIDGQALLELTNEELKLELGVMRLGQRKRLLRAVRALRQGGESDSVNMTTIGEPEIRNATGSSTVGFDFGGNWQRYMLRFSKEPEKLNDAISVFVHKLHQAFGIQHFGGLTFLDIGAGHGLASLAALHLHAEKVISVDLDTRPVSALRNFVGHLHTGAWDVIDGSILNTEFVQSGSIPKADLIWSYGVIQHTGNSSLALRNLAWLARSATLIRIGMHCGEELPVTSPWLDFKSSWNTLTPSLKEEALIAYLISELWGDIQKTVRLGDFAISEPMLFDRFHAIRKTVHGRFFNFSAGRGMDYVIDAVDWLGGYPYELLFVHEVVEILRAAENPLRVLLAAWDEGFAELTLAPLERHQNVLTAVNVVRSKLGQVGAPKPYAFWMHSWTTRQLQASAIGHPADDFEAMRPLCDDECLGQIMGMTCWFTALHVSEYQGNSLNTLILEDGHLLGWGAAQKSLCSFDVGPHFQTFDSGLLLFSISDGSDPRTNGRVYEILSVSEDRTPS